MALWQIAERLKGALAAQGLNQRLILEGLLTEVNGELGRQDAHWEAVMLEAEAADRAAREAMYADAAF